ncbi:histidine phosphatase family protein [Mycolicibacter minnesotensis]
MQRSVIRPWTTATVALLGAGAIAAGPVATPLASAVSVQILLAAQDITIDLIRHAQSEDNAGHVLGTIPPGAPITSVGVEQAQYLADPANPQHLADPSYYAGIYASEFLRTQQTAAEWLGAAGAPDTSVSILGGLNEINAGWLEDGDLSSLLVQVGYAFAPLMWTMGSFWVPMLGSDIDPNGVAFNDRVTDAIQTIYGNTIGDPDSSDSNVAFAHAGTIAIWTLMNVRNPDFGLVLEEMLDTRSPLANTGQVVIEGNPTDGWTLVSWNGTEVSATPDLFTSLFVDWRDFTTAGQIATWHVIEAFEGGDHAEILAAMETGFDQVVNAFVAFPQDVFDSITSALGC